MQTHRHIRHKSYGNGETLLSSSPNGNFHLLNGAFHLQNEQLSETGKCKLAQNEWKKNGVQSS